jgi:hypothetical protein
MHSLDASTVVLSMKLYSSRLRHCGKDEQEAISKHISITSSTDNAEESRHVQPIPLEGSAVDDAHTYLPCRALPSEQMR